MNEKNAKTLRNTVEGTMGVPASEARYRRQQVGWRTWPTRAPRESDARVVVAAFFWVVLVPVYGPSSLDPTCGRAIYQRAKRLFVAGVR